MNRIRLILGAIVGIVVGAVVIVMLYNSTPHYTVHSNENPVLSPDGKHIVFTKWVDTNAYATFIMNADGTNEKQMLPPIQWVNVFINWSQDSSKIGVTVVYPDNHTSYLFSGDGTLITELPYHYYIGDFTPGNKGILMGDSETDSGQLHLITLFAPDKPVFNTELFSEGSSPVYSPDGKNIAFIQYIDQHFYLSIMDTATRSIKQLDRSNVTGQWSPDGKLLLYKQYITAPEDYDIKTIRPDGSDGKTILKGDQWTETDWSPDGKKIVFTKHLGNSRLTIFIMNSDGSGEKQLSDGKGSDSHPQFTPDGQRIIFDSYRDEMVNIYSMNIDGTDLKQLTRK